VTPLSQMRDAGIVQKALRVCFENHVRPAPRLDSSLPELMIERFGFYGASWITDRTGGWWPLIDVDEQPGSTISSTRQARPRQWALTFSNMFGGEIFHLLAFLAKTTAGC
jgi:hypothetical protein